MQNFVNFLFEKVYKITKDENEQIEKLVKKYEKLFFKDLKTRARILIKTPQEFFKDKLNPQDPNNFFLGSIKYEDLKDNKIKKTKVFVNFEIDNTTNGEYYDAHNEIILYFHSLGSNKRKIKDTLTHELLHAKQQYKTIGSSYKKSIRNRVLPYGSITMRSNRGYFFDPLEMPVYTTLIVRDIISNYKSGDRQERKIFKNYIRDFIKRGAKLDINDSLAPAFLLDKANFLKFIYKNKNNVKYRKNYNDFLKKLFWAYTKMK